MYTRSRQYTTTVSRLEQSTAGLRHTDRRRSRATLKWKVSRASTRVGRTLPSASSGQALSDAFDLDSALLLYQLQNLLMQPRLQFQFEPISRRVKTASLSTCHIYILE